MEGEGTENLQSSLPPTRIQNAGCTVVGHQNHVGVFLFVLFFVFRVLDLCESRGGRPGLPVLMSLMVFVDVKQH